MTLPFAILKPFREPKITHSFDRVPVDQSLNFCFSYFCNGDVILSSTYEFRLRYILPLYNLIRTYILYIYIVSIFFLTKFHDYETIECIV